MNSTVVFLFFFSFSVFCFVLFFATIHAQPIASNGAGTGRLSDAKEKKTCKTSVMTLGYLLSRYATVTPERPPNCLVVPSDGLNEIECVQRGDAVPEKRGTMGHEEG